MQDIIKKIGKRIKDKEDLDKVRMALEQFDTTSDRSELSRISGELFPLEKKYMPAYRGDCDILICTVGMQKQPIILSIIATRPSTVFLLHTGGSEKTADDVINDADIYQMNVDFRKLQIDEIDAARNYSILKKNILPYLGYGKSVRVDPTGGRKIMGTAVGSFAFFYRLPMIYLHSVEKNGRPVPFSEVIKDVANPYEFFGDIEMKALKSSFDRGYFQSALEICKQLQEMVHDPSLAKKLDVILEFIQVYRDWDMFLHSKYCSNIKDREDVTFLKDRLESVVSDCERYDFKIFDRDQIDANLEFLEALEQGWSCKKDIVDKYRLIDLFLNAQRRASQGQYDDATARLYRCIEMCANLQIDSKGLLGPGGINYTAFGMDQSEFLQKFREVSGHPSPQNPPGLNDLMVMLQVIKDPVGMKFKSINDNKKGKEGLRDKRNRSILAHGTSPITAEDYHELDYAVSSMISLLLGKKDFSSLKNDANFPELLI